MRVTLLMTIGWLGFAWAQPPTWLDQPAAAFLASRKVVVRDGVRRLMSRQDGSEILTLPVRAYVTEDYLRNYRDWAGRAGDSCDPRSAVFEFKRMWAEAGVPTGLSKSDLKLFERTPGHAHFRPFTELKGNPLVRGLHLQLRGLPFAIDALKDMDGTALTAYVQLSEVSSAMYERMRAATAVLLAGARPVDEGVVDTAQAPKVVGATRASVLDENAAKLLTSRNVVLRPDVRKLMYRDDGTEILAHPVREYVTEDYLRGLRQRATRSATSPNAVAVVFEFKRAFAAAGVPTGLNKAELALFESTPDHAHFRSFAAMNDHPLLLDLDLPGRGLPFAIDAIKDIHGTALTAYGRQPEVTPAMYGRMLRAVEVLLAPPGPRAPVVTAVPCEAELAKAFREFSDDEIRREFVRRGLTL